MAELSEFDNKLICPRCGLVDCYKKKEYFCCSSCHQYLDNQELSNPDRVVWTCNEGDPSFASPYRYRRCLVRVPGVANPVATGLRINQDTVEFIRKHFVPRDSDIWLATYPKSGTTWFQNILSLLVFNEGNARTGGVAVGLTMEEHVPWFEAQCVPSTHIRSTLHSTEPESFDCTEFANHMIHEVNTSNKRRIFKSHTPLGLLEPMVTSRGRVIHVARNPKDVAGKPTVPVRGWLCVL